METQRTTVRRFVFAIIIALVMCVAILLLSGAGVYAETAEEFTLDSIKSECKELTDYDVMEGAAPLANGDIPGLKDYIDFIDNHQETDYPDLQNDYIWRLIPKELFRHTGEWFYRGAGYSFYVHTLCPIPSRRDYYSDVAFIDNRYSYNKVTNEITVGVSIKAYSYNSYYDFNNTFHTEYYGTMTKMKYYLTDLQFFTVLKNEHELNNDDDGYSKFNDNGTIITQTRVNYAGLCDKYDTSSGKDIIANGLKLAMGKIPFVKNLYQAYTIMWNVADTLKGVFYEERVVNIENNNERNIHTLPTREAQRESENEGLIRSVSASPAESGIMVNNYAEMITLINGAEPARVSAGVFYRLMIEETYDNYIVSYRKNNDDYLIENAVVSSFGDYNADKNSYPPICTLFNDKYFDEDRFYEASEGENDVYLLEPDSVHKYLFSPERDGDYNFTAERGFNITVSGKDISTKSDITELVQELNRGKQYKLFIKGDGVNYKKISGLNIKFAPEEFKAPSNAIKIGSGKVKYMSFVPDKTGLHEFDISSHDERVSLQVENTQNGSVEAYGNGSRTLSAYLLAGNKYFVVLANSDIVEKSLFVTVNFQQEIQKDVQFGQTLNISKVYAYKPTHNGNYTLTISAESSLSIKLRNDNYEVLSTYEIYKNGMFTYFYVAGQTYYFDVSTISKNARFVGTLNFTPLKISEASITVDNISDYNVVEFVPKFSGEYMLSLQNDESAILHIYTASSCEVTNQKLQAGDKYYIYVKSEKNSGVLDLILIGDELIHNRYYSVNIGDNVCVFTAPVSGRYHLVGCEKFVIADRYYSALYDESNNNIDLYVGTSYYIVFSSEYSEDVISIYFNPEALPLYGNISFGDTRYFKLDVPESAQFAFDAKVWAGKPVSISLFDCDLNIVRIADATLTVQLGLGRYYIKAEVDNSDTMLSIRNDKQLGMGTVRQYIEGTVCIDEIQAGESIVYEYIYTKNQPSCRFVLKSNVAEFDNILITVYYCDAANNIKSVEVIKADRIGQYYCDLNKNVGKYYIEIQSERFKSMQFSLYVPAVIESVLIDGLDVGNYINALYLGINSVHEFRIVCNAEATSGTSMRLGQQLDGVSLSDKKVTIKNMFTLENKSVDIYFETIDGNDSKMYTFIIKHPYIAYGRIYDDRFHVEFKNLYGRAVDGVHSDISYYYIWDTVQYELSGNDKTADLVYIPNVDAVNIFAKITYKYGYQTTISSEYKETVYALRDNENTTGKKRLLIDASYEYYNSPKEINVPKNIMTLNLKGTMSYYGVNIIIADNRTEPLYININNFSFTSNTSAAIFYSGNQHVYLNIFGRVTIETGFLGASAIDVPYITIAGGELDLLGENVETSTSLTAAGSGIKATDLSILGCVLKATGGHGRNSKNNIPGITGAYGGNGITTQRLTIKNSTVTAYGGNGADGGNGSAGTAGNSSRAGGVGNPGGKGGNGGYGIYTGTCSVINSTLKLYGGDSGNGGKGGAGGNGGTLNIGGRGGNGGKYGDSGKGCNINIASAEMNEGNLGVGGTGGAGGNGTKGGNGGNGYFTNGGNGGIGSKNGNGSVGNFVPDNFRINVSGQGTKISIGFAKKTKVTFYTYNNSGDPYLTLYNSNGLIVAQDDNSRGGNNASITYSSSSIRPFVLIARAANNGTATFSIGATVS